MKVIAVLWLHKRLYPLLGNTEEAQIIQAMWEYVNHLGKSG